MWHLWFQLYTENWVKGTHCFSSWTKKTLQIWLKLVLYPKLLKQQKYCILFHLLNTKRLLTNAVHSMGTWTKHSSLSLLKNNVEAMTILITQVVIGHFLIQLLYLTFENISIKIAIWILWNVLSINGWFIINQRLKWKYWLPWNDL